MEHDESAGEDEGRGELGVPFDELMRQAVRLKEAQLQPSRRAFDTWPPFYQHSMFATQDTLKGRTLPFAERLALALDRKERANELIIEKTSAAAEEALTHYEQALALFRYVENTQEDWKHKAIEDDSLRQVEYVPETDEQRSELRSLYLSCYLNLAYCYITAKQFHNAVLAADAALQEDPASAKAYYRRAQARILPASSGALEQDMALKDMAMAVQYAPTDAVIRQEFLRLKESKVEQARKDKQTFDGLFQRGAIYDERGGETDEQTDITVGQLEEDLKDAKACVGRYEREGRLQEARALAHNVSQAEAILKRFKSQRAPPQKSLMDVDVDNPSDEDVKIAKAHGLDIKEPNARRLFKELRARALAGEEVTTELIDSIETNLRLEDTTKVAMDVVRHLSRKDTQQLLRKHEMAFSDSTPLVEMHGMLAQAVARELFMDVNAVAGAARYLKKGTSVLHDIEQATKEAARTRSRRISAIVGLVMGLAWLLWRLWASGTIRQLLNRDTSHSFIDSDTYDEVDEF